MKLRAIYKGDLKDAKYARTSDRNGEYQRIQKVKQKDQEGRYEDICTCGCTYGTRSCRLEGALLGLFKEV